MTRWQGIGAVVTMISALRMTDTLEWTRPSLPWWCYALLVVGGVVLVSVGGQRPPWGRR